MRMILCSCRPHFCCWQIIIFAESIGSNRIKREIQDLAGFASARSSSFPSSSNILLFPSSILPIFFVKKSFLSNRKSSIKIPQKQASSFPLSLPIPSQCLKTGHFRGALGEGEGQEDRWKGRGFLKGGAMSQQQKMILLLSLYLPDFFLFLIRHIFSGSDFGYWLLMFFHFFSFSFWEMDGKGGG